MNDAQWNTLAGLFEKAMALPAEERSSFLEDACGDDEKLRDELASLLANSEKAPPFFESLGEVLPILRASGAEKKSTDPFGLIGSRIAQYDVVDWLGGGGMGVVYKAEDLELQRPVALKFLPPALSYDDEARARFVTEARAASRLDHPNICTVHEIGRTDEGQIFIAMAYYEGETLKDKIAKAPLSIETALEYARQIARGLGKAHVRGIFHRDIKPANLMVTPDGVVKILDFGLAKMSEQQLTQTGSTMGTIAYMSPEQAMGGAVDHRTDIWSLGVVLYEMVTGSRPFEGAFANAIQYNILHSEPVFDAQAFQGEPGARLLAAVEGCLQKEPSNRYASIETFLQEIDRREAGGATSIREASGAAPVEQAGKSFGIEKKWIYLGALVVVLAAVLFKLGPVLFSSGASSTAADSERHIAVLPFETIPAGDEENQAMADGLMYVLTSMLAHLESPEKPMWVVPASEVRSRNILNSSEALKVFNVNSVLQGSLQKRETSVAITLDLVEPKQVRVVNSETAVLDTETINNPLGLSFQEQLMERIASLLKIDIDDESRKAARATLPGDPDAYAFYLQGIGYLQRYDKAGSLDNAVRLFGYALEEDSLYALAHAGLCEALLQKYTNSSERSLIDNALSHCFRASELADMLAPVQISLGRIYHETGRNREALTSLRRAIDLEPESAEAYRWLGRVYENMAMPDSAATAYQNAINLKPELWLYYQEFGLFYYYSGRYEEALEQFEWVPKLTPDNHYGYNDLGITYRALNESEKAEEMFLRAIELQPTAVSNMNLGRLYMREKRFEDAVPYLEEATRLDEDDWRGWSFLGHAYHWAGDTDNAQSAWRQMIAQSEPKLDVNPEADDILLFLTEEHILLGNVDRGRMYLDRLLQLPLNAVHTKFYLSRIFELLGDRDSSLDYLGQALEARFDRVLIENDPWLNALRETQEYEALLKRYPE